ncbi:hypothetical protein SAMN05216551_102511 [Chitinasiproducens palmae]|uniref:Uncharacterized protein n=1 Tax=Chitinasiproducens palmae TaxID=1770053 RepID=A0A1H2PML6_9BURK|nr:hypothetical protein SAMN05216551_102511 [Chitinasiproducens palmae]
MNLLKSAIDDLFDPKSTVADATDRHFAADFRQRVNGLWIDRAAFVVAVERLRVTVASATVTALDEFVDGARYAARHVIDLRQPNGERLRQEVYVFGERGADGRFTRPGGKHAFPGCRHPVEPLTERGPRRFSAGSAVCRHVSPSIRRLSDLRFAVALPVPRALAANASCPAVTSPPPGRRVPPLRAQFRAAMRDPITPSAARGAVAAAQPPVK